MKKCFLFLGTLFLCVFAVNVFAAVPVSDKSVLIQEIKKKEALAQANSLLRGLVRGIRDFYRAFGDPKNKENPSLNIDGDIYDKDCNQYDETMKQDCRGYWQEKENYWQKMCSFSSNRSCNTQPHNGDPYPKSCTNRRDRIECERYWKWKKQEAEKKDASIKRLVKEYQMGIIPQNEFTGWVKPILLKRLQTAMAGEDKKECEKGELITKNGTLCTDVGIKDFRKFVMTQFFPIDEKGEPFSPTEPQIAAMLKLRIAALKTAVADAYSLSMTAQHKLSAFNEVVIVPFKEELETSEDLEQRIKKNTLIILTLFSQVNLDNILANSGMGVQSVEKIHALPISDSRNMQWEEE